MDRLGLLYTESEYQVQTLIFITLDLSWITLDLQFI